MDERSGELMVERLSKRPEKIDPTPREDCFICFRAKSMCICSTFHKFEIEPMIVLLVHPREFMRTIGTARIVKHSLKNSIMWRGTGADFDRDAQMNTLLTDPKLHPVILFPGEDSVNLSKPLSDDSGHDASAFPNTASFPRNKRLVIFVLDGTWTTAKQILRMSQKLPLLQKVSFEVNAPSAYEFRKQPKEYCLSTVEAVSLLIECLVRQKLCARPEEDAHLKMLRSFEALVRSQVAFERKA